MRIIGVIRVVEQPTRADISVDGQLGNQRVQSVPNMGKFRSMSVVIKCRLSMTKPGLRLIEGIGIQVSWSRRCVLELLSCWSGTWASQGEPGGFDHGLGAPGVLELQEFGMKSQGYFGPLMK